MTGREALVIGGQGVLGRLIARDLAGEGWRVTRAGRRPEDAPDFRLLDLDDPSAVRSACARAGLVVNTAHHPKLAPERTVLDQGGALIELTELSREERAELRGEVPAPHGLVVCDSGLGGVAYLALRKLLDEHREADLAEYSLMVSAGGSSGRAGALFGHRLLTGSSHHNSTKVAFPEPFGERHALEVDGSGVLRSEIAGVPLRHYLCMQPRALNRMLLALNGARLIALMPRASFTAGTRKPPSQATEEPICEWVAVSRGGRRLATRTISGQGYYRMTSAATCVFAEVLSRSQRLDDGGPGLRSIDELIGLAEVRQLLEEHGIAISQAPDTAARAT
jgi:NAD(P)-dependent dehydrogenase (short-subunit alcohol dehydrogenase family)